MPEMMMNQFALHVPRAARRRAFTLIEILIVIGLSALLFALLLIPLISAINYTRQAQSLTAAQDAARITRERLTRELSSAVFVFDNTSHPFIFSASPKAGDDLSTNFLNLEVPTSTPGTTVVAHAYSAKLDFALPRVNDTGVMDPTTGEPIAYKSATSGSAVIVSPSQVFPAAAGITMVRYWIGLQDPTQPYNNPREQYSSSNPTNTYILYRAQFQPYKKNSAGKYGPNYDLFAKGTGASGISVPELDDPDFFRTVNQNGTTDVNWLDSLHGNYPAQTSAGSPDGSAAQHNYRVEKWQSIAKPVIPGPNIDLLLLPHNTDNTLNFDNTSAPTTPPCSSATVCNGVAHSGVAHDPVTGGYYPIVNTSVTFRPGTISGDATPATNSDYISQGVPQDAGDSGFAYIPTTYTASSQSWSLPYKVTLSPPTAPSGQASGGDTYTVGQDPMTGDTYEYSSANVALYDLTTAQPILIAGVPPASYIPLSVNADSGTISFDTPSFPDPTNHFGREWQYTPTLSSGSYQVDLTANDALGHISPLGVIVDPAKDSSGSLIKTARLVPGSVRVYGPDETAGPGQYQINNPAAGPQPLVLYTEASSLTAVGSNLYRVNYAAGTLQFLGNADQFAAAVPVKVIYDYQANMAPVGTKTASGPPVQLANFAQTPMNVSVDYRTRDLLDISIGVRIYDLSTGRAQVIPSEFKAKIGNSNR